jgi:regulator of sirC expression with transglutaminase-like and TPR domain
LDPTLTDLADLAQYPDALIDLGRGALLISALFQPGLDQGRHIRRLDDLAEAAGERVPEDAPIAERIAAFHRFLFVDEGFAGNVHDYEDPRNSFLDQVMERGLGIPIALSVLYVELARRIDLPASGIGFPGHFIVKVGSGSEAKLVDPFASGALLDTEELDQRLAALYGGGILTVGAYPALLRPATHREILVRMLRNLKSVYRHRDQVREALTAISAILTLAPDLPDEVRDRGLLYRELGYAPAALEDLRRFVRLSDDAEQIAAIGPLIEELAGQGVRLH